MHAQENIPLLLVVLTAFNTVNIFYEMNMLTTDFAL